MTAYVMTVDRDRPTISATWASMYCDVSRTVTTVADIEHAHGLCWCLTKLSENAWEATAWLDTAPAIETAIGQLITDLRAGTGRIPTPKLALAGRRHFDAEATWGVQAAFDEGLVNELNPLGRAQRLAVADDLDLDQDDRLQAVRHLDAESELEEYSRGWEIATVSRSLRLGIGNTLPDDGNTWISRWYGSDLTLPTRWRAVQAIRRLEQLAAACTEHGGRGELDWDCGEVRLTLPPGLAAVGVDGEPARTVTVTTPPSRSRFSQKLPRWTMQVLARSTTVIAEVDSRDDDAFAKVLGGWARRA